MIRRPLSQIQVHSLPGECIVIILFTHMHSHYKSNFLYSEKGHSFPLLSCCQFSWLCDFKIFVLPISFQTCFTMLGNMHGRSLANQIFIRLREKKTNRCRQNVHSKNHLGVNIYIYICTRRMTLYWFVTIGANLKKRYVCRCEVKTLLCNKITRRTHSIVIVNYTLCGFRWKRIIYLSNILIKTQ